MTHNLKYGKIINDPETGRFISQDSIDYADPESINGLNLYAYCGNNPVMNVDPTGTFFLACLLVGLIVGAIAGAVIGGVQAAEEGYTGWDLVGAIFTGMLIGGAFGAMAGALVGLGGAMIGSGLSAISGAGGLLALAGGGTAAAVAAGGVVSAGLGAVVVGGGLAIAGVGINVLFSKHNPGMSNKPPVSWTDIDEGVKIYNQFGKNSEKATEYLLNNKYGIGNWYKGAKTEFNALKKWFDRIIRLWGKG